MSVTVPDENMATREAIRSISESRRSVRQFLDEPVPEEDVTEILRLTGLAPSAMNAQPWRWAVVRSPDMTEQLSGAMTGNNVATLLGAPVNIVLYSDGVETVESLEEVVHPGMGAEEVARRAAGMRGNMSRMEPARLREWARTQTHIALGQIVLIARGMGYDTVTMGGFREDEVKQVLGLSETASVTSVIALGKRQKDGFSHHRHPVERVTRFY